MLKDFVVADNAVDILAHGKRVDLHNDSNLTEIRFRPMESGVEFEFTEWTETNSEPRIVLVLQFFEVDWIQISPGILIDGKGDIAELGYKEPADFDYDWLLKERDASSEAHLFIRFERDQFIRLHARRATAIL